MSRFLSDEWDKMRAQKRGGGVAHVPVQLDTAKTRYGHEPADNWTPDAVQGSLNLAADAPSRHRLSTS